MSNEYDCFHIHADNIVECERTLQLVESALADQILSIAGPSDSSVCPSFSLRLRGKREPWQFTFSQGLVGGRKIFFRSCESGAGLFGKPQIP